MKKIFTILCASITFCSFAASNLTICTKSGENKLYNLSDIKEITFPAGSVNVTMQAGNVDTYTLDTFQKITFDVNDGIYDLFAADQGIIFDGTCIKAPGASSIEVYAIDGKLIKAVDSDNIPVDNISTGTYIVRAAGKTAKIVKR